MQKKNEWGGGRGTHFQNSRRRRGTELSLFCDVSLKLYIKKNNYAAVVVEETFCSDMRYKDGSEVEAPEQPRQKYQRTASQGVRLIGGNCIN